MNSKGQRLYREARRRIPGGTQLLSKRPEMFAPDQWPCYYSKALGAEVWDLEGRRYLDMSYNGVGSLILGAADPEVDRAVSRAMKAGSMSTLNAPEEVELAELLCQLHPWADMVRYSRCGGEAMAIAVRIVRARTGREKVAFCGYHGWHDWYLAANLSSDEALDGHLLPGLSSNGVPRGLIGTALPFRFNCIAELEEIVSENEGDLAAIIMEPVRDHQPREGFLEGVRAIASDAGAVLVFDEITAGFRHTTGGSHLLYGVDPDVAVFAKGMSNGYAMAAVIGRSEIMDAAQSTFISSTYWTERLGPAAALATIKKHQRNAVGEHLDRIGRRVQRGWKEAADRAGLLIEVGGLPPISHFAIMHDHGQEARTLFTQLMLERGFLASRAFYATYAHQDSHVSDYLAAVEEVFCLLTRALDQGAVNSLLRGPVAHNGFHRLT